ncbi:MAG: glycine cleavage system protein H [Methylotenera sp.]|nr:glycine cleavage system protein H [Methylotenera sp.]
MQTPTNLLYSPQHLWMKALENNLWEAGITDYAQDLLGDIVFVDAPVIGAVLYAGKACGLVESVKTGSDLHALVDGVVTEVNQEAINSPELINDKPYQTWIFRFKSAKPDVAEELLSASDYQGLINAL